MKLFRNPEIRRTATVYALVSLAFSAAAFCWDIWFGVFVVIFALTGLTIFLVSTAGRYRRLAALSADIDRILHGNDPTLAPNEYAEGELCILQNEVYKMTVRLREQKQHLQDDKIYLANSIADISHQIRTPLTSINLLVQLLREPNLTPERKTELTRQLLEMLSRIDWLITTLLKISKLDAGTVHFKPENISAEALVRRGAEPLMVPMELREQSFSVTGQGNLLVDAAWTCEAISNIVKNCMEHTPVGGSIRVEMEENPLYTKLRISDTGCGISKEDLPHIFERFYKGKDSGDKSFGVGLALARMIVTKQNGTLKAENKSEGGAAFTMCFYKSVV